MINNLLTCQRYLKSLIDFMIPVVKSALSTFPPMEKQKFDDCVHLLNESTTRFRRVQQV